MTKTTLCINSDELMRVRDRDYRMGQANVAAHVQHVLRELTDPERIDGVELLVRLGDGTTVPALQYWSLSQLDKKLTWFNNYSRVETGATER